MFADEDHAVPESIMHVIADSHRIRGVRGLFSQATAFLNGSGAVEHDALAVDEVLEMGADASIGSRSSPAETTAMMYRSGASAFVT